MRANHAYHNQTYKSFVSLDSLIQYAWIPLAYCADGYSVLNKIVGRNKLLICITIPLLVTTICAYSLYHLEGKISSIGDSVFENYLKLGTETENQPEVWNIFFNNVVNFLGFHFINVLVQSFEKIILEKFNIHLFRAAEDSLDKNIYSNQNLIYITGNSDTKVVFFNRNMNLSEVVYNSGIYLTSSLTTVFQGALGFIALYRYDYTLPLFAFIYGMSTQYISRYFSNNINNLDQKIQANYVSQSILTSQTSNEARILVESKAEDYTRSKLEQYKKEERTLEDKRFIYEHAFNIWSLVNTFLNIGLRWYLFATKLYDGTIKVGDRAFLEVGMSKVNTAFSYVADNSKDLVALRRNVEKTRKLINELDTSNKRAPEINYRVKGEKLIIKDCSIYVGQAQEKKLLLEIPDITLNKGTHCAIIGPSGVGKSSFVSKLIGITADKNVTAVGDITYPMPSISAGKLSTMLISQRDYIPQDITLLELVYMPKQLQTLGTNERNGLENLVIRLLKEVAIDKEVISNPEKSLINKLNQKEDWSNYLSGGQKRKIKLIGAILHKPDVLIMDETFAGLDHESVEIIENTLCRHLPNAIVLSIDHHHKENNIRDQNSRPFYSHMLDFGKREYSVEFSRL